MARSKHNDLYSSLSTTILGGCNLIFFQKKFLKLSKNLDNLWLCSNDFFPQNFGRPRGSVKTTIN